MKYWPIVILCLLLQSCGSSSDPQDDSTSLCNASDINSQIGCELQRNYLWYKELRTVLTAIVRTPTEYFNAILSPRDTYSFITTEQEYQDRFVNAVFLGFGFATQRTADASALQVLYVYDSGSAAQQGLRRGDKITEIEGISVAEWLSGLDSGRYTNDDIYGPNEAGIVRNFVWTRPDNSTARADFQKSRVTTNTVLHRSVSTQGSKKIGYLVFNQFIELSETELEQAFVYFAQQQINELILDVRYNGGGLVRVANQLSSHIAYPRLQGKVFVKYRYNDKNTSKNNTVQFSPGQGRTLLNLPRVVVLTTPSSCSSSELVINAMSPFVEVVQIGQVTCGKPVGQIPTRIADYRLFAINFQTLNALDFGDYFNGLQPSCNVTPAITGDWGVSSDPLYAAALSYLQQGQCPASAVALSSAGAGGPVLTAPLQQAARNTPSWRLHNEQ